MKLKGDTIGDWKCKEQAKSYRQVKSLCGFLLLLLLDGNPQSWVLVRLALFTRYGEVECDHTYI